MLTQYPYAQRYLFTALESAPALFDHLLRGLAKGEADFRPDPERFTIREVMAHLADWETVFRERMARTRSENQPTLPGYDEAQWAINHDYARTDLGEQTRLFGERRAQMLAFLRSCQVDEWQRAADRPEIGLLTLEAQATLVALHDTYHLQQVAQWRERFAAFPNP